MATILTKEQDERAPIKQVNTSRKEVEEAIQRNKNELTGIFQRQLTVEQERAYQFKDSRARFGDEYSSIEDQVTKGLSEISQGWNDLLESEYPLEFDEKLRKQREYADEIVKKKLDFIRDLENEVNAESRK